MAVTGETLIHSCRRTREGNLSGVTNPRTRLKDSGRRATSHLSIVSRFLPPRIAPLICLTRLDPNTRSILHDEDAVLVDSISTARNGRDEIGIGAMHASARSEE